MDSTAPAATPPSNFARVRRLHERARYDEATIHAILDAATHVHVGHIIDGRPVVIPTLHWREGDTLYWHGSAASRMLRANAGGMEVCVTATLIDGFVLARSGFHHSANYRSAMCFGSAHLVTDPVEKARALDGFIERLFPGRPTQMRGHSEQELKATSVLAMPIREASAKLRTGPPKDDAEDMAAPVWAGVVPMHVGFGTPIPDPAMPEFGTPPPPPPLG